MDTANVLEPQGCVHHGINVDVLAQLRDNKIIP